MDPIEEIIQDLKDFSEVNNHPLTMKAATVLSVLNKLNGVLNEAIAVNKIMLKNEQAISDELAKLLDHTVFDHDVFSWCENRTKVLADHKALRATKNENVQL